MSTYTINVSFQTRVNKTTRTLEIAESFGLGLDEKTGRFTTILSWKSSRGMWFTSLASQVPENLSCYVSYNAR